VNSSVDVLHGVLIVFRMGEYLCCGHYAAFGSPTSLVLVPGAYTLIIVFALVRKVPIGAGIGSPCWLHFRAHS